ncbi:CLIP-associating protein 1, partial [Xenoophorus captivus]
QKHCTCMQMSDCVSASDSFYDPMFCFSVSGSMMEYDTENMNAEEIYSSLRGVTEAIQSFSYRSQEDLNEPLRRDGKRDDAVSL